MKPGYLYELWFPHEEGSGGEKRPTLILVISDDTTKVTQSGPNNSHP